MTRITCFLLATAFALLVSVAWSSASERSAVEVNEIPAGRRIALVIGNSAYQHTTELRNPGNDAKAMAALLRRVQFEVVEGIDLNRTGFFEKIEEFGQKAEGAEVALFFYAGHGMQVGGRNYLLPIDAKLESRISYKSETIDVDDVLQSMGAHSRVSIALLDACRDNPLSRRFALNRSISPSRGLAMPEANAGGILIGFATAPGETAADGTGRNSPFAAALLKHLESPGLEIEQIMKKVRTEVTTSTNAQQRPWINSNLSVDFYISPSAWTANLNKANRGEPNDTAPENKETANLSNANAGEPNDTGPENKETANLNNANGGISNDTGAENKEGDSNNSAVPKSKRDNLGQRKVTYVPQIPSWNRECKKLLRQYDKKPGHKAFAVSSATSSYMVQACAVSWSKSSIKAAEEEAIRICHKEGSGCVIRISE